MQTSGFKYRMAAWTALAIVGCVLSGRPADATIFDFSGSCDNLFCPILGFGTAGSAVTGQLDILDGAVGPGALFANTDILSFSLTFELRNLEYAGPFFNFSSLPGPVGQFDATGLAIESIQVKDSLNQTFEANLGAEGSFFFSAVDTIGFKAVGAPISFDIQTAVSEPGSIAMFLFTLGSLVFMTRRRLRAPITAS